MNWNVQSNVHSSNHDISKILHYYKTKLHLEHCDGISCIYGCMAPPASKICICLDNERTESNERMESPLNNAFH